MPVTIKYKDECLMAFIKGEIDHHTTPSIREQIDDAFISNESIKKVVLDFKDVTFMDSSGVGLVMGRYRLISQKKVCLVVDNLSSRDYKIMKMSGIEKLAEVNQKQESEDK